MSCDHVRFEREGPIGLLTVDRRPVLNALDRAAIEEIGRIAAELQQDDAVRVLIVTGAGEKAFVAGADIRELARLTPLEARSYAEAGQRVLDLLEHLGKPVIAAVNGYALGGGCELALACTFRVAAETARFGQPEVTLGLMPGFGGTQRLPRLVGVGPALDILLTGRTVEAAEALRIGLVHRVVPTDSLMAEVRALAGVLAALAPVALRHVLESVHRGRGMGLADALAIEADLFGLTAATADAREGTDAFLAKRKATFTGR